MSKLFSLAALIALGATAALAGGMAEPIVMMEPTVVEEAASSSAGGLIIPLILLLLIGLALSGGSGELSPSDARLKTDIVRVGTAHNGLPLYHYRYVGLATVYEGVMAQDVLEHTPAAVGKIWGDYYGVNYDMLGLEMKTVH